MIRYEDIVHRMGEGPCPFCKSDTVLREGPYGKFYGCVRFPECRGTRTFDEDPGATELADCPWPDDGCDPL